MISVVGSLPALTMAAALWGTAPTEEPPLPHLFGTHALEAAQSPYLRWPGLRAIGAPYQLTQLVRPLQGDNRLRQVMMVNGLIQTMISYGEDRDLWGRDDYWAAPQETWIRRKGDCEDLALLKRAALIELGVPDHHLALLVGRRGDGSDHAMLAVWLDGRWLFLDDDEVPRRSEEIHDFEPVITLIGARTYLHGRDTLAPRPAGPGK